MSGQILSFAQWLITRCKYIHSFYCNRLSYKLVKIDHCDKSKEPVLTMQVKGQNQYLKMSLTVFFNQNNMLKAICVNDLVKIIEFKTTWALSPQVKLASHFFHGCSTHVVLQDRKGNRYQQDVKKVGLQRELIKQLSSKDAFLLGYLVADQRDSQLEL